jgi:15-cis-phytoene synthase
VAARDTNFYYSFVALPEPKRQAIMAVWDFFRAVDDAVDEAEETPGEPGHQARERLLVWRTELAACFEGGTPRTPQGQALVPHIARFALPRGAFEDVIAGVEMDITATRRETVDELRDYCLKVASAVGLVCIEIFGYTNGACRQYAIDLGLALQLTNIIRDLGKDASLGRIYLPLADLRRFGVNESDVLAGHMTPALRELLGYYAGLAHSYYETAERELPKEDARHLVAARIMSRIYQALLRRIEMRGFDVLGEPLRLPRWRKALIAIRVWITTQVGA